MSRPDAGFTNPVTASMIVVFPAPFGTDEPDDLAGLHVEAHVVDRGDPTETDGQVLHDERGGGHRLAREVKEGSGHLATADETQPLERGSQLVGDDFGDTVLVRDDHEQQDHATHECVPLTDREHVVEEPGAEAADGVGRREGRADGEAETTDHRPTDAEDRLQRAVLLVRDGRRAEAEQDAGEPGDRGSYRERVELDAEHADAEGRGRALVRADCDQTSARA